MSLRQEAEQLAKIYVPVLILKILLASASARSLAAIVGGINGAGMPEWAVLASNWLPLIMGVIEPLAIGIWLYFRAKSNGYNSFLWLLFGLAGNLFAASIYFFVRAFEEYSFNKESHPTHSARQL
ncbi:hypothetical protein ACMXYV_09120 [Neptuniibacter sp. SY11_33]|uniref:hypothetical protein n=1 Tax=Neptuniibacter sp. SY11_33 TaxID=3398215 RepID=UPI0039F5540D